MNSKRWPRIWVLVFSSTLIFGAFLDLYTTSKFQHGRLQEANFLMRNVWSHGGFGLIVELKIIATVLALLVGFWIYGLATKRKLSKRSDKVFLVLMMLALLPSGMFWIYVGLCNAYHWVFKIPLPWIK